MGAVVAEVSTLDGYLSETRLASGRQYPHAT